MRPLVLLFAAIPLFLVPSSALGGPCVLPAQYTHTAVVVEGDLQATMGTDAATCAPGDTVRMALLFQNTGSDTLIYPGGVTPLDGFSIVGDSCATADAPGCFENRLWYSPEFVYYFSPALMLHPGECKLYTTYWDGLVRVVEGSTVHYDPAPPGAYRLFGGLWTFSENGQGYDVPIDGVMLPLTIEEGVPVEPITWGGLKTRYR
jgi:hypothetical protein